MVLSLYQNILMTDQKPSSVFLVINLAKILWFQGRTSFNLIHFTVQALSPGYSCFWIISLIFSYFSSYLRIIYSTSSSSLRFLIKCNAYHISVIQNYVSAALFLFTTLQFCSKPGIIKWKSLWRDLLSFLLVINYFFPIHLLKNNSILILLIDKKLSIIFFG